MLSRRHLRRAVVLLRRTRLNADLLRYVANKGRAGVLRSRRSTRVAYPSNVMLELTNRCNLHCITCAREYAYAKSMDIGNMPLDKAKTIIDELYPYLDSIGLTGLGEPLMNPNIADMVATLRESRVAEKIEIFTNASLLVPAMADKLLDAGLTKLRISVQGTDAGQYRRHCGVELDFDSFIANLRYFHEASRGRCDVYIKIIDEELRDQKDRETFFAVFSGLCDEIFVENLVRAQPSMGDYGGEITTSKTFYGETARTREVCPFIFYTLQTDAEGNCFPCPPLGLPRGFSLGNLMETPLHEIWCGARHRELMRSHLRMDGSKCALCKQCVCYRAFTPDADNLDDSAKELLHILEAAPWQA